MRMIRSPGPTPLVAFSKYISWGSSMYAPACSSIPNNHQFDGSFTAKYDRRCSVRHLRQGRAVGPLRAVLITVAVGERIDLITAHEQDVTAGQEVATEVELRLGEEIGHRVR